MVKVFGPMMSLDASGTLGQALTFSKWKGRNYVRERVIPSNPQSGGQVGRRAMFTYLTQKWDALSDANKATWQDLADQLVALRFNAYLSANMQGWHNFLAPSYEDPAARSDAVGTWGGSMTVTWEENRIKMEPEITLLNQNSAHIIFASLTTPLTTAVGNAILIHPALTVKQYKYFWTPPSVATWYFNHRAISVTGVLGTQLTETSAAP